MPFTQLRRPKGNDRILSREDYAFFRRYYEGDEFRDRETGEWSRLRKGRRACVQNLHMRKQLGTALGFGLGVERRGVFSALSRKQLTGGERGGIVGA